VHLAVFHEAAERGGSHLDDIRDAMNSTIAVGAP
jgi:hypothetical protein